MIRFFIVFFALIILMTLHVCLYGQVFDKKKDLNDQVRVNYVLPSEFTRVAALDFKGLAADFQLLQAIFFIGEKVQRSEVITETDWDYFTRIIRAVVELDPYFYDTYHFSTAMLTWGSGRFEDAIEILEVARKFNPEDYRFPFHLGFIHFYFLNDAQKGAQYLELASRLPDAPPLFASLAARLAYYKGNYQFSIDLLERMLASERSPEIRKYYEQRLFALQGALTIERAIHEFKTDHDRLPTALNELIELSYLVELPKEPYGGDWIILDNGRVYSTSKFAEMREQ